MLIEINVKHLIAKPLLMRTKLLVSICVHAILHVVALMHINPTSYHKLQLAYSQKPNVDLQMIAN